LGTVTLSRRSRIVLIGGVSGACAGLMDGIVTSFAAGFLIGEPLQGFGWAVANTPVMGMVAALIFATVHRFALLRAGRALEPTRVRIRIPGAGPRTARKPVSAILKRAGFGFATGLAAGFVIGFLTGLFTEPMWRITNGCVGAVILAPLYALGGGLVMGLMAVLEVPIDSALVASPRDILSINRNTMITGLVVLAPMFGLVVGFGGWFAASLLHDSLWGMTIDWTLDFGLWQGLGVGLGAGAAGVLSLTAWGQWVVLVRIWLPLTRQLPWRTMGFLEEARERGVLRQNGGAYQFRHELLQAHLLRAAESRRR
jgi:hypothetical protein